MVMSVFTGCSNKEPEQSTDTSKNPFINPAEPSEGTMIIITNANGTVEVKVEGDDKFANSTNTIDKETITGSEPAFITEISRYSKSRFGWSGTYRGEFVKEGSKITITPNNETNAENIRFSLAYNNKENFNILGNKYKSFSFDGKEIIVNQAKDKVALNKKVKGENIDGTISFKLTINEAADITITKISETEYKITSTSSITALTAQFTDIKSTEDNPIKYTAESSTQAFEYTIKINADSVTVEAKV